MDLHDTFKKVSEWAHSETFLMEDRRGRHTVIKVLIKQMQMANREEEAFDSLISFVHFS